MIAKKDKGADLERKRFAFFQIGLIVSGSLCLAAFEYSTARSVKEVSVLGDEPSGIEIEIPPTIEVKKEIPEQKAKVFTDQMDTFNVVQRIEKTARYVDNHSEVIEITEGTGEEQYGFGITPEKVEPTWDYDKDPVFPGGVAAMYEWIAQEVDYPEVPAEMGIDGTVFVSFVVNSDGSIVQVKALNELDKDLEKEAIRVVSKMPKWSPGERKGKALSVYYQIPFRFALRN